VSDDDHQEDCSKDADDRNRKDACGKFPARCEFEMIGNMFIARGFGHPGSSQDVWLDAVDPATSTLHGACLNTR